MSFSVHDLTLARGQRVLMTGLNLHLTPGSIHAVVGGNGSGKSTLVSALAGDLVAAKGEIYLSGERLGGLSDAQQARHRAVLTQATPALPYAPWDLIELAAPTLDQHAVADLLDFFALGDLANRQLLTLSGGERGRALLAMTIARGTQTLLLDEPTAAFDRTFRHRFVEWMQQWREQGKAILIVTHDAEIEAIADQVTSIG